MEKKLDVKVLYRFSYVTKASDFQIPQEKLVNG
jgi:hypothetical protein